MLPLHHRPKKLVSLTLPHVLLFTPPTESKRVEFAASTTREVSPITLVPIPLIPGHAARFFYISGAVEKMALLGLQH